jgi:hypothetical protein
MRRVVFPILATTLAMSLSAGGVLAAQPTHERLVIDETSTADLCGLQVTQHVVVHVNVVTYPDGLRRDLSTTLITWTNADGDWLSTFSVGPFIFSEVVNADGTTTFTLSARGVQELVRSARGIEAAFDRGQITFVTTIDFGDPENPDDDVVIFDGITFVAGPHPEADSDFALFCQVVTEVLG